MAHCVYSCTQETELMKDNSVLSPIARLQYVEPGLGIAPVRSYLDRGLNIGLGSDVAGGQTGPFSGR